MTFLQFRFFISILLCSILFVFSTTSAELINSLPGQPEKVNFKQYSSYIVTDNYYGRALFYYFVEVQLKNPLTLPLKLRLGGAHGCSSVGDSIFTENGPFRIAKDGNLKKNEFSWNLVSNMLYVESPIGVGFSYSNTSSDYTKWNDTMTSNENLKFLLNWFKKFPKYRNLAFYLAGDSYGGHLVPQLATLLLEYNRKPHVQPIKLKGITLGNPIVDSPGADLGEYLWYHGLISVELRTMQKTLCNLTTYFYELQHAKLSKDCLRMMLKMDEELGDELYMDSVLLPKCTSPNSVTHLDSDTTMGDPCLKDRTWTYLNKPEVQKTLHANTTGLPYPWNPCHGSIKFEKNEYAVKIFSTLLSVLLKGHIPILLYSGDQDMSVPVTETRKLAYRLAKDLKLITLQRNRPWYDGFQVGGWSEAFGKLRRGKNVTYLTFASVKGGDHSVPFTSPSKGLTIFKAFIKGYPLPLSS